MRMRFGGYEVEVKFNDRSMWLCIDEIELLQERESRMTEEKTPKDRCADERFNARRLVEALRLGIVPLDRVEEFTFGRKKEIEKIEEWLRDSNPQKSTLLVMGEYGVGKTHLLHCILSRALKNGYAVAWTEINWGEFCKPKTVYKNLTRNFRYPTRDGNIGEFHEFVRSMIKDGDFDDNHYFRCLIPRMDDSAVWEWIGGWDDKPKPYTINVYPPILSTFNSANIYCYLISTLGWASKNVFGLRGLLLVFDEMETIFYTHTAHRRHASRNFLEALIKTARDLPELKDDPQKSGLNYSRQARKVPFIYKTPTNLKIMLSLPTDWQEYIRDRRQRYTYFDTDISFPRILSEWGEIKETIEKAEKILLKPLPFSESAGVIRAISYFYQQAYNLAPFSGKEVEEMFERCISEISQKMGQQGIRFRDLVKWSVEHLDLKQFGKR